MISPYFRIWRFAMEWIRILVTTLGLSSCLKHVKTSMGKPTCPYYVVLDLIAQIMLEPRGVMEESNPIV